MPCCNRKSSCERRDHTHYDSLKQDYTINKIIEACYTQECSKNSKESINGNKYKPNEKCDDKRKTKKVNCTPPQKQPAECKKKESCLAKCCGPVKKCLKCFLSKMPCKCFVKASCDTEQIKKMKCVSLPKTNSPCPMPCCDKKEKKECTNSKGDQTEDGHDDRCDKIDKVLAEVDGDRSECSTSDEDNTYSKDRKREMKCMDKQCRISTKERTRKDKDCDKQRERMRKEMEKERDSRQKEREKECREELKEVGRQSKDKDKLCKDMEKQREKRYKENTKECRKIAKNRTCKCKKDVKHCKCLDKKKERIDKKWDKEIKKLEKKHNCPDVVEKAKECKDLEKEYMEMKARECRENLEKNQLEGQARETKCWERRDNENECREKMEAELGCKKVQKKEGGCEKHECCEYAFDSFDSSDESDNEDTGLASMSHEPSSMASGRFVQPSSSNLLSSLHKTMAVIPSTFGPISINNRSVSTLQKKNDS